MSLMETTVKKGLRLNLWVMEFFFSLDTCSTHLPVEMLAGLSTQVGTCSLTMLRRDRSFFDGPGNFAARSLKDDADLSSETTVSIEFRQTCEYAANRAPFRSMDVDEYIAV